MADHHCWRSCKLGDNCIHTFHLGRYIVGYTVGNLVLRNVKRDFRTYIRRYTSPSVKRDFRTYIRRYTSPNEKFEYGYPHSNALLTFSLQKDSKNVLCCAYTSSGCQMHKTACHLHIFTIVEGLVNREYWLSDFWYQVYQARLWELLLTSRGLPRYREY